MGSLISSLRHHRQAQSSGLSPSPTEEAAPKAPAGQEIHVDEEFKSSVAEDKPPEEPESNDTSYGVEATAVRALAASTCTVAILGTTAKVKEVNESTDDLKHSPIEKTEDHVFETEPQNETVEISVSPEVQNEPNINSLAPDDAQEKGKRDFNTDDVVSSEPPKIEEEKKGVQIIVVEVEETKPTDEPIDEKSETIKPNDRFTTAVTVEKEPVRIFELPEKKDRVHDPEEPESAVAILGTTAAIKEVNESTDDLKHSPMEKTEDTVFVTEPQNETVEISVSPKVQNASNINSLAADDAQEKEKSDFNTGDVVSSEPPKTEVEKKEDVQVILVEVEETQPTDEPTDEKSETIKPNDQFTTAVSVEKEPVRIFDLPEKKDRVHEPKIVEEMSVKKDEKSERITDLEEISNKTREFVLSLSIEKTNFKDEISDQMKEPVEKLASQEEEQITPEEGEITPLESIKVIPESEPDSPEISKTEDDNEISSEQLKTNSLSDISLSDALNSEGEEAAREAAKAQELREMVESLSATANRVSLEYQLSEDSLKGFLRHDTNVGTSLQEPEPILPEPSKTAIISKELGPLSKENLEYEVTEIISQHSPEPTFQQSPEPITQHSPDSSFQLSPEPGIKIQPGTLTIIESSEDTNSNSEISQEEKELTMLEEKETLPILDQTMKHKKNENNTIEEKEKDDTELEVDSAKQIIAKEQSNKLPREALLTKETEIEQKYEFKEAPVNEEDSEVIAAATTIQAGYRGYQARKNRKENEAEKEYKQAGEEQESEKSKLPDPNSSARPITPSIPEIFDEKGQTEEQEKYLLVRSDSKTSEPDEATETPTIETTEESVKYVPESLIKIAQAEVDKICTDAEKATESLMTPPIMKDYDDMDEADIQEEDFPAPPDDLLTSETESKNGEAKDEQSSSGTQSTEPTMPMGNNLTEGDSSKTEDTTAPSLAESEMLKSAAQSPSQQNDDLRLESSFTENINTEVALQRDSTEGEFTMEEDSTRDDDIPTKSHSGKVDVEERLTGDEEKAATVIQAGYRGFKTRKRLREESSIGSPEGEESEKDNSQHESVPEEESKKDESSSTHSSSIEKSEKEIFDSAKKIQAGVRGYLVRKKQKVQKDAAVTIQSYFRGFKTRQRLKQESS